MPRRGSDRRKVLWAALAALGLIALLVGWSTVARGKRLPEAEVRRLRHRAAEAVKTGRFDEAQAALERLGPRTAIDWMMRSKVDLANGRPDAAIDALAKIPDNEPLGRLARYSEGFIELKRRHRPRAAERALKACLATDPRMTEARRLLIELYDTQERRPERDGQLEQLARSLTFPEVYHWSLTHCPDAEMAAKVESLRAFVAADPADDQSRIAMATALIFLHRLDEAGDCLNGLASPSVEGDEARARLALKRGEKEAARRLLDRWPAGVPALAELRGRLALAARDGVTAAREYRLAHEVRPGDRAILRGLGQALRLAGRGAEADEWLDAAARRDRIELLLRKVATPPGSDDAGLLRAIAEECEAVGRIAEAACWYRLALARDPADASSRAGLGRLEISGTAR